MNPVETKQAAGKQCGGDSQPMPSSLLMLGQQGDNASGGPPALSAAPTLPALLQALKRRWLFAVAVALLAASTTVTAVFNLLPPKFNVTMRLRAAKVAGTEESNHAIFTANMEALVKSPLVINSALNEKTAAGRDIKDLDIVRGKGLGAVEWLEKALKTDYKLGPEVMRVTLAADEPDEAADLLNAIARAFLKEYAEMERSKKQQRLADLRSKKDRIEEDLNSLRRVLKSQVEALDVKDREALNVQQQQWINKLAAAEAIKRNNDEELLKAENEIVNANARLASLDKQEVRQDVLFEWYGKDPGIQGYLKRGAEIDAEIARIYKEFNEPFATQKAGSLKQAKVALLKQQEDREIQIKPIIEAAWRVAMRTELQNQIEIAQEKRLGQARRQESLVKEIQVLEKKVKDAGPGGAAKPPQIQATEDKIELAKASLQQISQKIGEVELEVPGSRIAQLERATAPLDRDRSQQTKIGGAGGLGMFIMALFGVAFLEFRTRKIGEADEIVHGLGLKVLGTVPAMPARSRSQPAPEPTAEQQWQYQLQEAMDAIRTVLLHQARSEPLHVLLVTSAVTGEGKTTLATQLAASLARAWKRTLVIDADLRHPATHALFDVPQEPGLAEVLRGEVDRADAVRATAFSRLWILPAGNGDAHAIQALAQDNVRTFFEQLKQDYDFVIIDAPPVLPVTDSLLLGQNVDALLFAILRDFSTAPSIHAALQKLAPLGVPTLGAVVLGTDVEFDPKNYGFGHNRPAKA